MIPALIGAGVALGSTIFGGIQSANARRKQQKALNQASRRALVDFNRDYYQDLTQRADMRYLLNKQREQLNEANRITHAKNVVAGGTTEADAVAKQASNASMADTFARIGAMSQQQKQQAVKNYADARARIDAGNADISGMTAQQGANLMASGASSFLTSLGNLADALKKPATTQTNQTT